MDHDKQALSQFELNLEYSDLEEFHIDPLSSVPSSPSFHIYTQDHAEDWFNKAIYQFNQRPLEEMFPSTSPVSHSNDQMQLPNISEPKLNDIPNPLPMAIAIAPSPRQVAPLSSSSLNLPQRTGKPITAASEYGGMPSQGGALAGTLLDDRARGRSSHCGRVTNPKEEGSL